MRVGGGGGGVQEQKGESERNINYRGGVFCALCIVATGWVEAPARSSQGGVCCGDGS